MSHPGATLYIHGRDGQRFCRLCQGVDGQHAPACVVIVLHTQLRELTMQLGLYVATMQETVESIDRVIRGDRPEDTPEEGSRGLD